VNSEVLPPVCPETSKYLEVHYQCEQNNGIAEEVRKARLPRLQINISDVWSNGDKMLDIENVDAAIDKVIANNHYPITDIPPSKLLSDKSIDKYVNLKFLNNSQSVRTTLVTNKKEFTNSSSERLRNQNTTTVPLLLTKSSLSDDSSVDDDELHWTPKEVLIIILSSSLPVILIIITTAMVIIKANPKCKTSKTEENLEMSGTGSSAQSECSTYTKDNSENLVNFQQRFNQFNPEAQLPHSLETNALYEQSIYGDIKQYDINHNTVQHCQYKAMQDHAPSHDKRPQCNIHIHYNFSYNPPCQCGNKGHCSEFSSDKVHRSDLQHVDK